MSRPGGNTTGFIQFEYGLSGKWLELLKQVAPGVTRAAVLREPAQTAGVGQFAVIQSVASSVGMEVRPGQCARRRRDRARRHRFRPHRERRLGGDGERPDAASTSIRSSRWRLGYRLPAVYPRRVYVKSGGLISYGLDLVDQFRRAAGYVDRILGEKPADLPVQAPTKYELVINLKTAKALGLDVPATVLARADEVIE